MGVYFGDTEITGLYFGDTEITGLYFGDIEIWAAWAEYDGTLPATYTANGSALGDYRVYGSAGGVGDDSGTAYGYVVPMSVSDGTTSNTVPIYIGDEPLGEDEYISYSEQKVYRRTEQLYNKDATNAANGYIASTYLGSAGQTVATGDTAWSVSEYIPVDSEETYTVVTGNALANLASVVEYDDSKNVVAGTAYTRRTNFQLTTNAQTKYLRISAYASTAGSQVVKGSTVPSTYIPYYDPQDPPVPLAALPTVDGTNIVDYAGQSVAVPERFYAKYKKG